MFRAQSRDNCQTSETHQDTARLAASIFRSEQAQTSRRSFRGLKDDLCQSPHWGYLLQGDLVVTFADGTNENVLAGDLFYWPPGHTVRVAEDAEVILFSPEREHSEVIDHMLAKMAG